MCIRDREYTQAVIFRVTGHTSGTIVCKPARIPCADSGYPHSFSVCLMPVSYTHLDVYKRQDGTVSTAIELEEGDQVKVWGYASQYLEFQEGLKIVVVQPGIIERNGELVILDKNLKVD